MMESNLPTILRLRKLVGFLGEHAQFGWWATKFYEPSSRPFLEPAFSKMSRLAQYHGVLEAARRLHDDHLNVGSFHLFRLPEESEQDLHAIAQSPADEELAGQLPANKETALDELKQLAGTNTQSCEGPIAVGNIKDLHSPEVLQEIAGRYWSAFSQNAKTYPYLVS